MSWAKLLADNRVTALPPSKAELDNLRSIVARSQTKPDGTALKDRFAALARRGFQRHMCLD
jgi:hypothetical protein